MKVQKTQNFFIILHSIHQKDRADTWKLEICTRLFFKNRSLWETRFSALMNLSFNHRVWRKPGTGHPLHNTIPSIMCGGNSIMMWAFFSSRDLWTYRVDLVTENLVQNIQNLRVGRRFLLQQDNDLKHLAKTMQDWQLCLWVV